MNKLKQVEVLPAFSVTFTTQVEHLAAEAKDLSKSYADLTERMLKFADRFRTLWGKASALDGNNENGQHKAHFLKVLGEIVNSDNPSIWSRWVTIGKQAKELLPHKAALPPQRDSLYALALATKEGKRLERWIDDGKLTNESTIRDVLSLTRKKNRRTAAKDPKKRRLLPIGLEDATVLASIVRVARGLIYNNKPVVPTEIFVAASSGTLSRGLQAAFPKAMVHAVQTGHSMSKEQIGRAILHKSPYKSDQKCNEAEMPPYNSEQFCDSKVWSVAKKHGKRGALIWNVA